MFAIDPLSRVPIYEQIVNQLETLVLNGILKDGDKVPSVRNLSQQLSINPNTIQKAYYELDNRGIIQSAPGKGCFITSRAYEFLCQKSRDKLGAFTKLTEELALAGVQKTELVQCIDGVYRQIGYDQQV